MKYVELTVRMRECDTCGYLERSLCIGSKSMCPKCFEKILNKPTHNIWEMITIRRLIEDARQGVKRLKEEDDYDKGTMINVMSCLNMLGNITDRM